MRENLQTSLASVDGLARRRYPGRMRRILFLILVSIVIIAVSAVLVFMALGVVERQFCGDSLDCGLSLLFYVYPAVMVAILVAVAVWFDRARH